MCLHLMPEDRKPCGVYTHLIALSLRRQVLEGQFMFEVRETREAYSRLGGRLKTVLAAVLNTKNVDTKSKPSQRHARALF